jgi:3-hydroxybutyryl-CoA dehydrogenase
VDVSEVRHVGVVGAGLMGSGIAEVVARAGTRVTFVEGSPELVEAGRARIEDSLAAAVTKGKLGADDRDAALVRLEGADDLAALADCDLVVEAATEDPEAKEAIFARLGELTRPEVVLASNTSSIPIARLAEASARPDRVIGIHFFNPVPVMPLVELIPAASTSPETLAMARAWAGSLGKECVVSKDEAGFIVNRVLIPFLNDAVRLLEDGVATREDIDAACRLGLGHPMGPLQLADLIGLDTVAAIGEVLAGAHGDERLGPPTLLRRLVAEGKVGRKSGEGFYPYGDRRVDRGGQPA